MELLCQRVWAVVILTHIVKLLSPEVAEIHTSISNVLKTSNFIFFQVEMTYGIMMSHFSYNLCFSITSDVQIVKSF